MPNKQSQIIILLGRSGCGKGTQAKLLIKDFGFEYLGTGEILRKRAKTKDFSGKKLKREMNQGGRVSTFFVFQIWGNEAEEVKNKPNFKGLVIDGSPRSLLEAELMDGLFDWYEWKNIKVILLDISHQEAFERLAKRRICKQCNRLIPWIGEFKSLKVCDQCGGELINRPDDKLEAIRERLNYYKKDVEPAIDYYQKQGRLIRVNGEKSIEDVYQDVKRAVEN
ncbi:MAG: nucleoside monophosphate kinase [Patescibacteria group bacterium]